MGFLHFGDFSPSPTILLPLQPLQAGALTPYPKIDSYSQSSKTTVLPSSRHFSSWTPAMSCTPIITNPSRKRCHDECLDEEPASILNYCPARSSTSMSDNNANPVGWKADQNMVIDDRAELRIKEHPNIEMKSAFKAITSLSRSQLGSVAHSRRKFQRHDMLKGTLGKKPVTNLAASLRSDFKDPAIDQFTRLLGVGWAQIGEDKDVRAAARGWAKYIENHYPLSAVNIVLRSKGLEACLAEAEGGYFLFKEDLSEGQLVGCNWETCLANLQRTPVVFEGSEALTAVRTPAPMIAQSPSEFFATSVDSNPGSRGELLPSSPSGTTWEDDDRMILA